MARGNKEKRDNNETRERKDFKHCCVMVGDVTRVTTFGKDDAHVSITIKDEESGNKYVFKFFNVDDDTYNAMESAGKCEISFNITYNVYKDNVSLQLVGYKFKVL